MVHAQLFITSRSINATMVPNLLEKIAPDALSNAIKPKEIPGLY
jgi:hypothetical protein